MDMLLYESQKFENTDYSERKVPPAEYNDCHFIRCNFTKADLSNCEFTECRFEHCNFSLAILNNTGLRDASFTHCKLTGVDFSVCNPFLFAACFSGCQLDYASFFQNKMKKTDFSDCSLKEVDFSEADLSMCLFRNCDLLHANFMRTNLEKADFRTAYNYSFDPSLNMMKKARFSCPGVAGLLTRYNIDVE